MSGVGTVDLDYVCLNTYRQGMPPQSQDRPGVPPPGYRLPDDLTLGTVRLQVGDLARSLAFYEGVLGLASLGRSNGVARLGPGGTTDVLVELHERAGARPIPRGGRLGLYHFALLLPDRAALGRFFNHLVATRTRAGSADHAVSEAIYLNDPDGLGIEVYADRPRADWRRDETGQRLMTTEPLDVGDLLAAGSARPWTGMPPGTTVGHMHLHVGNLALATDFYHRALGFDRVVWTYPGALFLSAGGYHHHLGTNTWASGPPATDGDARLLSWALKMSREAAAKAARSLTAAGYAVQARDDSFTSADPWGTELRF